MNSNMYIKNQTLKKTQKPMLIRQKVLPWFLGVLLLFCPVVSSALEKIDQTSEPFLTNVNFNDQPENIVGSAQNGLNKSQLCRGCHEISGYKTAFPIIYHVPKLAGQHSAYIETALKAYRSNDRNNSTMHAIASTLSDQDIADLAAYYGEGSK